MNIKRFFYIVLIAIFLMPVAASAQQKAPAQSREQWFKEMREYKHQFLAKELGLTKAQEKQFYAVYDEMDDKLLEVGEETRALENKVKSAGDKATDVDYDRAIDAIISQKAKEGEIERTYMTKLKTILNKNQLFQLKAAERKFAKDIMKHHRRLRSQTNK